jgi:hypothetical protein
MVNPDFYGALRPVLFLGWALGVVPISNIIKNDVELLSCKFLSPSVLYSLLINFFIIVPTAYCVPVSLYGIISVSKGSLTDTLSLCAFVGFGLLTKYIIVILGLSHTTKILKFIKVSLLNCEHGKA